MCYRVTINVKEKADGNYVYSYNAERQNDGPSTRQTLHADVNQTAKSGEANARPANSIADTTQNSKEKTSAESAASLRRENARLRERVARMARETKVTETPRANPKDIRAVVKGLTQAHNSALDAETVRGVEALLGILPFQLWIRTASVYQRLQ